MAETQSFSLLCLENPLLDIQGVGDEAMLTKYGMKPNDTILAEEKHMPIYDDLLSNRSAKLIAGGAAQNTARGAQYMLPPHSVWFIGCVGDDQHAQTLRDACDKEGVHTEYRVDASEPTGRCGVVITGHNRSMCTHLAAANEYKLEHLKQPRIWGMVERTEVFYVGGYHLTVCVPAILALAEEALDKNKPFLFGLGAAFIPQFFAEPLAQVLPYCDYVFGNEDEAEVWAKGQGHETTDLKEIGRLLCEVEKKNKHRPRTVVITHGTHPTITARMNAEMVVEINEIPVHAIAEDEINDTNGAGDAFAGGFTAGVVQGKSLEECVHMGQWLARLGLRELGPSYPFPKQTYKP